MRKRIFVLILTILTLISLLIVNVEASSFSTVLTPSSTSVEEATELTVTISISNLDVGDNGINAFSAYLDYDTDVFENLTDSSVEGLNDWECTYTTDDGKILLESSSFVNEEMEIAQITLKTKEGVQSGTDGVVGLSNIVVTNSEDKISGSNVSTTISVGTGDSIVIDTGTTTPTDDNLGGTVTIGTGDEDDDGDDTVTTPVVDTGDEEEEVPYTGVDDSIVKIILGIAVVGIVLYIKIEKMKDI